MYTEAVTDMRSMIEKELKEMQRIVSISMGDLSIGGTMNHDAEKQDGQKSVTSARTSTRGSTRASIESDLESYASSSRMTENSLQSTVSASNNNEMTDRMNADTISLQSSVDEDFVIENDLILKMEDLISSPVLPSRYFEGSPIVEKTMNGGILGMDDSFISTISELSTEDPMSCSTAYTESDLSESTDHTMYLLDQLALQVTTIHQRVCSVLTRKYNSVMSADDKTQGLDQEVIARFTDVKPLFEQLEKV